LAIKKIDANKILVTHPLLKQYILSNQPKYTTYIKPNNQGGKLLDSDVDGSTNSSDIIKIDSTKQQYVKKVMIHKIKSGFTDKRFIIDENTNQLIINDKGLRTTADEGGYSTTRGVDIKNLNVDSYDEDLIIFIKMLKQLEKRIDVKDVSITVDHLPLIPRRKFAFLSDGKTRRKFALGVIKKVDGSECCLIDVNREGRRDG